MWINLNQEISDGFVGALGEVGLHEILKSIP
jgi:hypothetical protein